MSAAEVAEMKQHLVFLKTWKGLLRLTLNASEDLLVNGQREPSDRGQCRHLLAKVDRASVEAALVREPVKSNPAERARLLSGAVRFTGDVGVLLLYLENLVEVRSRAEAAQALSEVVARIDFAGLSAPRLARLLQVLMEVFAGAQERIPAVLGLMGREAFRAAYDAAADRLPPEVRSALDGFRALQRRAEEDSGAGGEVLVDAIMQLAALDAAGLRALPEGVRKALVECALELPMSSSVAERLADTLRGTLPGAVQARLGVRQAAWLLARARDDQARAVLEDLKARHPDERAAARWLNALDAPRVARVALPQGPRAGRVVQGWWLDSQRDVWVRRVPAERVEREVSLQRRCVVGGVAPVVLHGAEGFVASTAAGQPLAEGNLPRHPEAALQLLAGMVRVLAGVALCGVSLPDGAPSRFLLEGGRHPVVTLVDLDGAAESAPQDAEKAVLSLWPAMRDAVLQARVRARLNAGQLGAVNAADGAGSAAALLAALER